MASQNLSPNTIKIQNLSLDGCQGNKEKYLPLLNIHQNVWILTYQYFMWSIRTSIREVVKSQKLHFKRFVTAGLLSSFFCKSKCIEDVGCSIILTLCCSPPGWNLGCDIGLAGVTGASLTFFFGLAPEFGVVAAPEIHQRILTFKNMI